MDAIGSVALTLQARSLDAARQGMAAAAAVPATGTTTAQPETPAVILQLSLAAQQLRPS